MTPPLSPARELKEESVARWVLQNGQIAGRNTDTLPSVKGLYVPIQAENQTLGVLGLLPPQENYAFSTAEISQIETFASLIASAFQRANRAAYAETAKVESESEKLRNNLLSSVSHDLRTPLASITGAADTALRLKDRLPQETVTLLSSIHDQSIRLAKLVTNLLDVTSLESGTVKLNKRLYLIDDVIGSALARMEDSESARGISVSITPQLPQIEMDRSLIEQVVVNLLDNAIRCTGKDGTVCINVEREADVMRIRVIDNGSGIPENEEEKIFEKFYSQGNRTDGNAGLGLAICRGIITAHGGMITARNNPQGGASFTFTLPGLSTMLEKHNSKEGETP